MRTIASLRRALDADVVDACSHVLGAILVKDGLRARIVEVEAYRAEDDPGCHAFRGKTPRNAAMFGPPGVAYVYFTYGNHWMLNVSAHPEHRAAAILIRAAEPLQGVDAMRERRPKARRDEDLLSGPGKLCAAFGIAGEHNGSDLLRRNASFRLEPGEPARSIVNGTRIGLAPGKGDGLPWRFLDGERLRWVSRPMPYG